MTTSSKEPLSTTELYNLLITANKKQTEDIKEEIRNNVKEITDKIKRTDEELVNLKDKCRTLDRKSRRNNLVVFGLKVNRDSLMKETLRVLNNHMQLSLCDSDIDNIYTIGKSTTPPVIIEFVSYLKKISLFKNVNTLKGTGIAIDHDLSKEDREKQKVLKKHQKNAKEQKLEAKIRGNKLIVGDIAYTAEELENLEILEGSETEAGSEGGSVETEDLGRDENELVNTSVARTKAKTSKRKRRKIQYSPKLATTRVTRQNSN